MLGFVAVALAVLLVGCTSQPVPLLAGGDEGACSIRAGPPVGILGVLVPDPESGTAINVDANQEGWSDEMRAHAVPVQWPTGYTGRRVGSGAVEVVSPRGIVVATTGMHVWLGLQWTAPFGSHLDVFPACSVEEA